MLGLVFAFASCSKNEPLGGNTTNTSEGGVATGVERTAESNSQYETLTLSVGSNLLGGTQSDQEDPRVGFYEVTQGGRPFAKLSFGVDGTKQHMYTLIVRTSDNAVLFEKNLEWTISNNGISLGYDGELKVGKIRRATDTVDPELRLVAIANNGTMPAKQGGQYVFTADTQLSVLPENANTPSTAAPHNSVPYVMSTKVKRKAAQGPDARKLVNAEGTARVIAQGNLVRFRVKNNTSRAIELEAVGRPPYYVPSLQVNPLTGESKLAAIVDPQPTDPAEYNYRWNLPSRMTIAAGQTTRTIQFWTPLYFPNNEKYTPQTNQTHGAPLARLNVYLYPAPGGDRPSMRRLKRVSLSTVTTNAERAGKQLYYDAVVTEEDMKLRNL